MGISARVATPSNPGAIEGGSKDLPYAKRVELFMTIFTGEVLTYSMEHSIYKSRTTLKTIQHGQSARFEAVGKTSGAYMNAGQRLNGNGINHNKVLVELDPLYVAHVSIFWPDEAQLHFEAIPIYAQKCAEEATNHYDTNVFLTLVKTSKVTTPVVSDYPKMIGTELTYAAAGDESDVTKIKAMIVAAIATQKNKGYNPSDLVMVCSSTTMLRLRADDDFVSKDKGASGTIAEGNANKYMGIEIVEDIYLEDKLKNHTGTVEGSGKYDVDCTNLDFIIFAKDAVATVELIGEKPILFDVEQEQSTYLGTILKVGHGSLNPGGALTVWKATA